MNLLHGKGLSLTLGGHKILERLDIRLQRGELLGLIGPNGAGKSSLLKILAGLRVPDMGEVYLGKEHLNEIPTEARARRIAWLGQQREVHWPLSVETLIELGRVPHLAGWEKTCDRDQRIIDQVIVQTDLQSLRQRPFNTLSGGEQARALLARALATQPDILLCDEPVAALDIAHQLDMMSLLANYAAGDKGVVIVLHDLPLACQFCDRLVLLHDGHLLAEGRVDTVLTPQNMLLAYQITPRSTSADDPFAIPWQRK